MGGNRKKGKGWREREREREEEHSTAVHVDYIVGLDACRFLELAS
jgi:hypothetical protein